MGIIYNIVLGLLMTTLIGCASHVKTWTESGSRMKGIPANKPTLVKVIKATTYEVKPGGDAKYCANPTITEEYDVMSLGEPYYIEFDPAFMAKGSFKVTFSDKGLLSGVELNSDPSVTENIGKINELVGTILPYAAAKKAALVAAEGAKATPPADELRSQNCLTKETNIKDVVKIQIKDK